MAKTGLTFLEFAQHCDLQAAQSAAGAKAHVDRARNTINAARVTLAAHQASGFWGRGTLAELTEALIGIAGRQNRASLADSSRSTAYRNLAVEARALAASSGRTDMLECDLQALQRRVQLPAPLAA